MKWEFNWKRLLFVTGFILITVLLLLWITGAWKPAEPGIEQMRDLLRIKKALEEYHQKYLKYPQSHDIPSTIGEFLAEVPRGTKEKPYTWMDNSGDDQKFCIWTELEKKYFLVSPCGEKTVDRFPATLDECCELSKPR